MNEEKALEMVNKIFKQVFDCENKKTVTELLDSFAFDLKLPQMVYDSTTNEETWAASINPTRFMTLSNMEKKDNLEGWLLERKPITNLSELLNIWKNINYMTTERVYDSLDVVKSDTIYRCEKVYQSLNCSDCKNLIFCDGCAHSEYLLASQRTGSTQFGIRVDDSIDCSNSYNVVCSNKISNSLFIQDCFNLHECIFCAHIANKKYCIANMQFEKEEYFAIKKQIVEWILTSS